MLEAVGPDLLHQLEKCFIDYVFEKWIWPLTINVNAGKVSEAALNAEFDARFAIMPKFAGLAVLQMELSLKITIGRYSSTRR